MTAQNRLRKLEQQRAALDRQIRQEKARVKSEERKRDTRRKIILGGLIETHCEMHPDSAVAREVPRLIERFVRGGKERALFGLEPLPVEREGEGEADIGPAANDGEGHG